MLQLLLLSAKFSPLLLFWVPANRILSLSIILHALANCCIKDSSDVDHRSLTNRQTMNETLLNRNKWWIDGKTRMICKRCTERKEQKILHTYARMYSIYWQPENCDVLHQLRKGHLRRFRCCVRSGLCVCLQERWHCLQMFFNPKGGPESPVRLCWGRAFQSQRSFLVGNSSASVFEDVGDYEVDGQATDKALNVFQKKNPWIGLRWGIACFYSSYDAVHEYIVCCCMPLQISSQLTQINSLRSCPLIENPLF